jgi:exosortase/archaeosortase family protein
MRRPQASAVDLIVQPRSGIAAISPRNSAVCETCPTESEAAAGAGVSTSRCCDGSPRGQRVCVASDRRARRMDDCVGRRRAREKWWPDHREGDRAPSFVGVGPALVRFRSTAHGGAVGGGRLGGAAAVLPVAAVVDLVRDRHGGTCARRARGRGLAHRSRAAAPSRRRAGGVGRGCVVLPGSPRTRRRALAAALAIVVVGNVVRLTAVGWVAATWAPSSVDAFHDGPATAFAVVAVLLAVAVVALGAPWRRPAPPR